MHIKGMALQFTNVNIYRSTLNVLSDLNAADTRGLEY